MKQISIAAFALITLLVVGCSWVKPEYGAEQVALVKAAHVKHCELIGSVNSNTTHKLMGIKRKSSKIADELLTLAKNEAHSLGADTLVALTDTSGGEQKFQAYKCVK